MIDSVLNLLVRCSHRRLTRPITPVIKSGEPPAQTYVVCLDCGKHFAYDVRAMQIGKAIDPAAPRPSTPPKSRKRNIAVAILAAVPAAFMLGTVLKRKREKAAPARRPEPNVLTAEEKGSAQSP